MAVDKVIQCCEKAIRNGTNIQETYTKLKALIDVNGGRTEYVFIKGNLQNSPILTLNVRFKDLEESPQSLLQISTVSCGTRIKFHYYPSDSSDWNIRRECKLDDLQDELEKETKKKWFSFEQFKPIYLQLNRDMESSEYAKVIKQIIAQFKLQKDFK